MKKIKLLTLSLGAIVGITACGGKSVVHNVDQTLNDSLPSTPVEIQFWHCLGQGKTKNLEKVVQAFNAKYEGHYWVNAIVPSSASYSALHDAIKTNLAKGRVPALAMGYPDSFSEYMGTKENGSNILRLKNFIEDQRTIEVNQIEMDPETGTYVVKKDAQGNPLKENLRLGFEKTTAYDEFDKDFVEAYRDEGSHYQFDGYWSLPMYKSTEVMFVNYDYFCGNSDVNDRYFEALNNEDTETYFDFQDQLTALGSYYSSKHDDKKAKLEEMKTWVASKGGYTYEIPETWTEMFTLAAQVNADRTAQGFDVVAENFRPVGYDSDSNLMISQMKQRGIPYTTDKDITAKADRILFNNDQAKALLTEIKGYIDQGLLATKYQIDSSGSKYTNDYFTGKKEAGGRCIMSIGSTGGADYQVTDSFSVEVAPVPYSGDTPYYVQQGPSICFFDNADATITTGAWLFYRMMSDSELNTDLATDNSYDPVRYSCLESQSYAEYIAQKKTKLLARVAEVTHGDQIAKNQFYSPVCIGSSTCREEIGQLILRAVHKASSMTIDENFALAYTNALNASKL